MKTRRTLTAQALALASALLLSGPTMALDAPKGRVVLTVSGKIGVTNAGTQVKLDMSQIEALPQHSFTTRTPWFDQPVNFTGPRLSDVLALVKASGSTLSAVAINDYKISIPIADASAHPLILARLINDKPIPVREKGPLFVIYNFDSKAELRASTYYERSIWQLKALDVQ